MSRCARFAVLVGMVLLGAPPTAAFIPAASKILDAVADAIQSTGRAATLRMEVALHVGEGPVVARGELLSTEAGVTRLELRDASGSVVRHLRSAFRYQASRDGVRLSAPRHFAPPFYLLQAGSGASLTAGLAAHGVATDRVVLGRIGERDCYVVGERLAPGVLQGAPPPALWVDLETLEILRVDVGAGEAVQLGPPVAFGTLVVPSWIEIQAAGRPPTRLEIRAAEVQDLPPRAFDASWLVGPR